MNILYIVHRIPYPPNKGDKITSFHHVKHLSRRHNLFVVCFVDEEGDMKYVENLKPYCREVHAVFHHRTSGMLRSFLAMFSGSSLSVAYYRSGEFRKKVRDVLEREKIDCCLIFSAQMAQYALALGGVKKIMAFQDVDSEKWAQYSRQMRFPMDYIYRMEGRRLGEYERRVARSVEFSIFVTKEECAFFASKNPEARLVPIRNGVDLEFFHYGYRFSEIGEAQPSEPRLVFVGAMDYYPNVDGIMYFAEGILPEIRRDFPGVWLDIVGRNPHPDVLKLASEQRHIRVTGTVEDVRPYMAGATIAIAPLRIARGVQNKVLEALSFGLPVVATMNAYEGIDVVPGRDLLVADTPVEFSSAIVDLLRNPGKRGSLSRSGRTVIESRYSWDATMLNLEHLLLEVCGDTRSKNSRDIVFRG